MASKPTEDIKWAIDDVIQEGGGQNKITIPQEYRSIGYQFSETPPSSIENSIKNSTYNWYDYLSKIADDNIFNLVDIIYNTPEKTLKTRSDEIFTELVNNNNTNTYYYNILYEILKNDYYSKDETRLILDLLGARGVTYTYTDLGHISPVGSVFTVTSFTGTDNRTLYATGEDFDYDEYFSLLGLIGDNNRLNIIRWSIGIHTRSSASISYPTPDYTAKEITQHTTVYLGDVMLYDAAYTEHSDDDDYATLYHYVDEKIKEALDTIEGL